MVAGPRWRFGTFCFLLYSQRFIKEQVEVARQKTNMFIVLFWEIVMILWVAFRVEDCCFVINLKWVEYTGPYIVHSHLLRIFALISTFFYTHLDEPYRILINYELPNLPSEVMFIIFFSQILSQEVTQRLVFFILFIPFHTCFPL